MPEHPAPAAARTRPPGWLSHTVQQAGYQVRLVTRNTRSLLAEVGERGPQWAAERPALHRGQCGAGRVCPGASCGGHERAHQADTDRGQERARWDLASDEEREPGTPNPRAGSSTAAKP